MKGLSEKKYTSALGNLWELVFLLFFVLFVVFVIIFASGAFKKDASCDSTLPNVSIKLNDVSLDEIHSNGKSIKYPGNSLTVRFDGREYHYDDVEIKGRGNFTWLEDKKPCQIKFGEKKSFLGMENGKKWVFLTNNLDDSALRNQLAFYINRIIDDTYPIDGRFVTLTIDEKELGLYLVTNKIEIGKNSVNLRDPYGILVEFDNAYCFDEDLQIKTVEGNCLALKDAVADDYAEEAFYAFAEEYGEFELAAKGGDYETVSRIVDVDSFVNYYLISEFSANPDAYVTSFYLYKDGYDDKIHAGPSWDFDGAFGNLNWEEGRRDREFYDPETPMARKKFAFGGSQYDSISNEDVEVVPSEMISKTMYYLMDMPEFYQLVCKKYRGTFAKKVQDINAFIDSQSQEIRLEAIKNNIMWSNNSFDEAVAYLKKWVNARLIYFDTEYGNKILFEYEATKV